ncbi:ABC transporter permease [Rhizobium sp.]
MLRIVTKRLALGVMTLLLVATIIFVATEQLPGDAASVLLGQNATPESLAAMRERLGLDEPALSRFVGWIGRMAVGDLGISFGTNQPVAPLIADRLWNTLRLAAFAAAMALPFGFLVGVYSATHAGRLMDRSSAFAALVVASLPEFFLGLGLVYLLAVQFGMFPAISIIRPGQGLTAFFRSAFLPALTLALTMAPHVIRMTRSAILSELSSSYVEMGILKGVARRTIIGRHVMPNIIGSLVSVFALIVAYLIAGSVVVETAFAFPGIGRLMVDAVATKDMPLIEAGALTVSAIYVITNVIADVVSAITNPRLVR